MSIRLAVRSDLARIVEIYNYYVINTPITFDLHPFTPEQRVKWFEEHAGTARHRLFVAEDGCRVVGYAGSGQFRDKAAYDTSVETTIYCAHDALGRGIGSMLYRTLFAALKNEDIHRILAGITIPNEASVRMHRRFGFTDVGVFSENGRKLNRYWDVLWMQRPLAIPGE
ncbi:MAG: N-acetyltransferase family protein [Candidatus Binatus sp.]|uniref:GNAT family N-acetyltransferase n=1 Tax=Candidatus Binatus sp. TaxID=2811406 RepID=UPI0027271265|nr:GNAT family N-acetyltransferase [Candidatus Binatus sp.]MDO8430847.1 N-acetyltransferase family protein [Candidatus Binatus sp.]